MSALARLSTALNAKLAAASPRERQQLGIAAIAIAVLIVASLADWSHSERRRLALAVPAATAQLARMQDQAEELGRLQRAAAPAAASPAVRAEAARAAAGARGLTLTIELTPEALVVAGSGEAAALLDWLASIQAEQRLRPTELELTPLDNALQIAATLLPVGDDGSR